MFLGEKKKKKVWPTVVEVLKNSRNGAFEIESTENRETKDRWATERQGTKSGGPKALAEVN